MDAESMLKYRPRVELLVDVGMMGQHECVEGCEAAMGLV